MRRELKKWVKENFEAFCILGIFTAVGLIFIADKLLSPIKGRGYVELREEMVNNFSKSITNGIKAIFEKEGVTIEKTYNLLGNLVIPLILFLVAVSIFLLITWFLVKSVIYDEQSICTHFSTQSIESPLGFITYKTVHNGWYIIVLNFKMALFIIIVSVLIIGLLSYNINNNNNYNSNNYNNNNNNTNN